MPVPVGGRSQTAEFDKTEDPAIAEEFTETADTKEPPVQQTSEALTPREEACPDTPKKEDANDFEDRSPNDRQEDDRGHLTQEGTVDFEDGSPNNIRPEDERSIGSGNEELPRQYSYLEAPPGKGTEGEVKAIAAIQVLSRKAASFTDRLNSGSLPRYDVSIWENASGWRLQHVISSYSGCDVVRYLGFYNMKAESADQWSPASSAGVNTFSVKLDSHRLEATHTWYLFDCEVVLDESKRLAWPAPRRLVQLREFHHLIKKRLGDSLYKSIFGSTPFARLGGPSGTTARLQAWFRSLTSDLSKVPPSLAALTLQFLEAPQTSSSDAPDSAQGARRSIGSLLDGMQAQMDFLTARS